MRGTVRRNLLWLGSSTVLGMVASFVYGVLVARYLGPTAFGKFALVVGVGSMFTSMALGGSSTALLVLAAQHRDQVSSLMLPGVALHGVVGVVAALISLPTVYLLSGDAALIPATVVYGCSNVAILVTSVPVSILRGVDRMEWGTALTAASWVTVVLTFVAVTRDLGFVATIASSAISQALVLAVVLPWAARVIGQRRRVPGLAGRLVSASLVLAGVNLVQSLHWRIGVLAVEGLVGSYQLGLYSAASKLVENLRVVPWFLLMAILPAFVRLEQSDRGQLQTMVDRSLRWIVLLAFPIAAIIAIMSPVVVGILYTSEYAPSASVLRLCALGLVPLFVHWVFLNALVAMRQERHLVATYVTGITVEVLIDVLLVPGLGADGAAVGYVVGEIVVAFVSGLYVVRALGKLKWSDLWRTSLPGTLAIGIVVFSPMDGAWLGAWATGACVLYVSGVLVLRPVTLSEVLGLVRRR